jgi:hypothetical protein
MADPTTRVFRSNGDHAEVKETGDHLAASIHLACRPSCPESGDKVADPSHRRGALYGDKHSIVEVGRCLYWGIGIPEDQRLSRVY